MTPSTCQPHPANGKPFAKKLVLSHRPVPPGFSRLELGAIIEHMDRSDIMHSRPQILVIMGSVRPNRICPKVADWIVSIGQQIVPARFVLVDLRDWPLPMSDEPAIPAIHAYQSASTKAWSRKISGADGFVFVTPQYNWGYPAALKNALDHLYVEWAAKPAVIVSYGSHGGEKCAQQLRQVLTGLKMKPLDIMPALVLGRDLIEANSGEIDPAVTFATSRPGLEKAFEDLAAWPFPKRPLDHGLVDEEQLIE